MADSLPPKYYPIATPGRNPDEFEVTQPWYAWFLRLSRGVSATVPLAKITGGGTDGSLTITNGVITSVVPPT